MGAMDRSMHGSNWWGHMGQRAAEAGGACTPGWQIKSCSWHRCAGGEGELREEKLVAALQKWRALVKDSSKHGEFSLKTAELVVAHVYSSYREQLLRTRCGWVHPTLPGVLSKLE